MPPPGELEVIENPRSDNTDPIAKLMRRSTFKYIPLFHFSRFLVLLHGWFVLVFFLSIFYGFIGGRRKAFDFRGIADFEGPRSTEGFPSIAKGHLVSLVQVQQLLEDACRHWGVSDIDFVLKCGPSKVLQVLQLSEERDGLSLPP